MNGLWFLIIGVITLVVTQGMCGLRPYFLHFPPPAFLSVPNGIETDHYPQSKSYWNQWSPNILNNSIARSRAVREFPSGPIPLILHSWVKPEGSEGTRLQNGTLIYYIGGPWGGIRANTPSSTEFPPKQPLSPGINSNSIQLQSSEGEQGLSFDREALLQRLPGQDEIGLGLGWAPSPNVDLTVPPPSRQQEEGPWGHGHLGFGWPSSTQLYDNKIPDITTATPPTSVTADVTTTGAPTRNQQNFNGTTTTVRTTASPPSTPSTRLPLRGQSVPIIDPTTTTTTTTEDPVAANTNARFPVSDSVRKFRRIVAQIRAITKKELGTAVAVARKANPSKKVTS